MILKNLKTAPVRKEVVTNQGEKPAEISLHDDTCQSVLDFNAKVMRKAKSLVLIYISAFASHLNLSLRKILNVEVSTGNYT